jgi:hypothetical protein
LDITSGYSAIAHRVGVVGSPHSLLGAPWKLKRELGQDGVLNKRRSNKSTKGSYPFFVDIHKNARTKLNHHILELKVQEV